MNYKHQFLIFTRQGINIEEYPAIEEHLFKWQKQLMPKAQSDRNIEGRKPGQYKWFEIQDITEFHSEFIKPKIIWPQITIASRFCFDQEGLYLNNKCYFFTTNDIALLSIMNSKLMWAYLRSVCSWLRGGYIELISAHMRQIPIPIMNLERKQILTEYSTIALELQDKLIASAGLAETRRLEKQLAEVEAEIDKAVYQLYGLTEKEIGILEGRG